MAVYGSWAADALTAWLSGKTIKAMLVNTSYVPNYDETVAPTGNEVSGTGYTAGGVTITVSFAYSTSRDAVVMTCSAPIDFGTVTLTGIGGIVFYHSGGKPIAADMFGGVDVAATNFTYTPDSAGLLTLLVAGS